MFLFKALSKSATLFFKLPKLPRTRNVDKFGNSDCLKSLNDQNKRIEIIEISVSVRKKSL